MDPIKRLSAMESQAGSSFSKKQNILQLFDAFMSAANFQNIEVPILDNTELFLRKSDGELAPQMYSFRDPAGQQVSLRPEITTQVMDYYLKENLANPERKFQYQGPVFRYSGESGDRTQFTQIGAELIGNQGLDVDVEILQLASAFISELGVSQFQCKMADLNLVNYIIDNFGLSQKAKDRIVENIHILKQSERAVNEFANRLSKSQITGDKGKDAYLSAAIENLSESDARQVLSGFLGWVNGTMEEGSLGRRSHEDVVSRLIGKLRSSDSFEQIRECLNVVSELIRIRSNQDDAIAQARTLFNDQGYTCEYIDQFEQRINGLRNQGLPGCETVIDFGLVRDFGYYTGIIFEIYALPGNRLLGGGGRYDALGSLLGATQTINALGFAFDVDAILATEIGTI